VLPRGRTTTGHSCMKQASLSSASRDAYTWRSCTSTVPQTCIRRNAETRHQARRKSRATLHNHRRCLVMTCADASSKSYTAPAPSGGVPRAWSGVDCQERRVGGHISSPTQSCLKHAWWPGGRTGVHRHQQEWRAVSIAHWTLAPWLAQQG